MQASHRHVECETFERLGNRGDAAVRGSAQREAGWPEAVRHHLGADANQCLSEAENTLREAEGTGNTMPLILDAVRCYATTGEICDAFRDVFGTYTETSVL